MRYAVTIQQHASEQCRRIEQLILQLLQIQYITYVLRLLCRYVTYVLILSLYFSLTCAIYGVNIQSVASGVLVYVMWLISGKQSLLFMLQDALDSLSQHLNFKSFWVSMPPGLPTWLRATPTATCM